MYKSSLVILSIVSLMFLVAACQNSDVAPFEAPNTEAGQLAKATTVTSVATRPFSSIQYIPCANGGNGETVTFTGTLHTVSHTTFDATGTFHASLHSTANLTGVGETGDEYVGNGTRNRVVNGSVTDLPYEETAILREIYVSAGPDNNLQVKLTGHITINPDGTITSEFKDMSVECQ